MRAFADLDDDTEALVTQIHLGLLPSNVEHNDTPRLQPAIRFAHHRSLFIVPCAAVASLLFLAELYIARADHRSAILLCRLINDARQSGPGLSFLKPSF